MAESAQNNQSNSTADGTHSSSNPPNANDPVDIDRIVALFHARDDTPRFVGLALLKPILDNLRPGPASDEIVLGLWESIPVKFLDRLVRSGCKQASGRGPEAGGESKGDGADLLDLAVSVLGTFAVLLNDEEKRKSKFVERIPLLVTALSHANPGSVEILLQTLLSLVTLEEGANRLLAVPDIGPLVTLAPKAPRALDVLLASCLAALSSPAASEQQSRDLVATINAATEALVRAFEGTDGVTLLTFVGKLLPALGPMPSVSTPPWLSPVVGIIHGLVKMRPNRDARQAWITTTAALLQAFPADASALVFSSAPSQVDSKPASYLLVSLAIVEIKVALPTLLEQANSPSYPQTSLRIASAYDLLSAFTGHLVRATDDDTDTSAAALPLPPDLLLKVRGEISGLMSDTVQYLYDGWEAFSKAGSEGRQPPPGDMPPPSSPGKRSFSMLPRDPLTLAALGTLALWLQEDDDNEQLQHEAAGLFDILLALYEGSRGGGIASLDFRHPVLVALVALEDVIAPNTSRAWDVLADDLVSLIATADGTEADAIRGSGIAAVLENSASAHSLPGVHLRLLREIGKWPVSATPAKNPVTEAVLNFRASVFCLVGCIIESLPPGALAGRDGRLRDAVWRVGQAVADGMPAGSSQRAVVEGVISMPQLAGAGTEMVSGENKT